MKNQFLQFPSGFLWGAATSAHQVEGDNKNSDWWAWEPGHVKNGEVSGKSGDQYHLFEEDFNLVKKLNHNAHRLSIEWARIEPEQGKFDQTEIEHYRKVLTSLKEKNIKVMLTLHHFTNPMWFYKLDGWEKRENLKYFVRYAELVAKELGSLVDFWITINEPLVYVDESYFRATRPPQKKSYWLGYMVLRNMAHAHRQVYQAIHRVIPFAQVGVAHNVSSIQAYRKHSWKDQFIELLIDKAVNHHFLNLAGMDCQDFLGLNYYQHVRIRKTEKTRLVFDQADAMDKDTNDMGWEIYPHGIFNMLLDLSDYNKPIYITENGLAADDDTVRQRFIVGYLKEIYHAIKAGVDVRGYFHWSLLDNFEWDHGFNPRFGLIHIDYQTFKRTAKPSAELYAKIIEQNGLGKEEMKYLGY